MRTVRSQSGFQLIECLVATMLGAMYCMALLQVYAESLRVTTTSSNKQAADLITQTVLDAVKETNYTSLQQGTFAIPLTTQGSAPHPLPTNIDLQNLTWIQSVSAFPGTANLTISNGPDANSKTAIVTVSWSDSQVTNKVISTMSIIHQNGIWYWNTLPSP